MADQPILHRDVDMGINKANQAAELAATRLDDEQARQMWAGIRDRADAHLRRLGTPAPAPAAAEESRPAARRGETRANPTP